MKLKSRISKLLVTIVATSFFISIPLKCAYADAFKVVTLGKNLNSTQKEDMLKYFNVTKEEANVIEVSHDEEVKYLGNVASKKQLGTRAISCSYVEPTDKGGLNISLHNIYWVTDNMIKNALITAGVQNAVVKASAPFNVSGTAALTGILKGFENSKSGVKLDETKKKTANEELVVTGDLGEKIGKDKAANLVNEVKKKVVKEGPKDEKEVESIVKKVLSDYKVNLSDKDVKTLTSLMDKINSLDINFDDIKDQLDGVTEKLKGTLTSEEAKGFFDNLIDFFSSVFTAIKDFFMNLF